MLLKGGDLMYRKSMSPKASKRTFTKGAMNVHPKNTNPIPQRGGLRL
jgi:hypothetical protein